MKRWLMHPDAPLALLGGALLPWMVVTLARFVWELPVPKTHHVGRDLYLESHTVAVGVAFVVAWCLALAVLIAAVSSLWVGQRRPAVFLSAAVSVLFTIAIPYAVQIRAF
jgi:hypothetical protein